MKAAAERRIGREVRKRRAVAAVERRKRLCTFISLSTRRQAQMLRLAQVTYTAGARARIGHCRHHCIISGRSHSIYSQFRLSRNFLKEFALRGRLYGVRKASW